MIGLVKNLFDTGRFMSHGHCYLWLTSLVRLHLLSDLAIGLSYVCISLTLVYFVRRESKDVPFHWIFLAFGSFIIACGATHFMEIWTSWTPVYWLSGAIKAVTACASVLTAFTLPPLIPKSLALIRSAKLSEERKAELEAVNATLVKEVAERKRAESEVRKLNEELEARVRERTSELARANASLAEKAAIVQHSQDAIFSQTLDGTVMSWNPAAEQLYGYSASEMLGTNANILVPDDLAADLNHLFKRLRTGEHTNGFDTQRSRKNGDLADVHVTISALKDSEGGVIGASVVARDITERRRAELHLRETQKLESLGLIAGGVAHDFNNLLVGILGNASLALDTISPSHPNHSLIETVVSAGEKAAHLTRQLLAYAGKGTFVKENLDISDLVRDISGLIQTSIPKRVQLRLELASDLPPICADASQMQQVIMNLVINGAEAIAEGQNGTVLVTTSVQDLDEEYLTNNFAGQMVSPGKYVLLEVHDSGCGISEELRARIFDPFFTTKFAGRGLGLAAVLGIVRSHQGVVRVYSVPGRGSTFKILIPASVGQVAVTADQEARLELRGTGTILVIDDEDVVRLTARMTLEKYGYTVLLANEGREGVELFRQSPDAITAVLLDMTMPVMDGEEAFRRIRAIRPEARVIVSSGYNETESVRRFTSKGIAAFIQKPYTAKSLLKIVKRVVQE